ncbi:MAG: response regulator transcription factor [Flavobacteriales bacterium]|nr:response regulator transcription factor [Flavobacteriales bacterium]MBX2959121.1 response regulator transcription factor [Flavobacteriales bacterium]
MENTIRVIIVDDHKMIRDGIKLMLKNNPEIKVVNEFDNGLDVIKYIDKNPTSVDVVLMDISMPKLDGIAATRDIKSNHAGINILAITMHIEKSYIMDMMKAGASGYVLKESGASDLVEAIKTIAAGKQFFSSEVSSVIVKSIIEEEPKKHVRDIISDREKEVILLVAQGLSNNKIGEKMCLSPRTVESHRRNILQKLDVKNTAELIAYANKQNWI